MDIIRIIIDLEDEFELEILTDMLYQKGFDNYEVDIQYEYEDEDNEDEEDYEKK